MKCVEKFGNTGLLKLIAWGREELLQAGIEEAQEECERVLMKLLECSRSELYLKKNAPVALETRKRFLAILEKRITRIPMAYLLKEADFWQETLYVDERCLIPRPETEILVEQVLKALGGRAGKDFSFLDIGTGSGAIAIAILRAFKNAKGTLLDISGDALEVAGENLKRYELGGRATLVQGDLFEPFAKNEKWDLIVSNPPYLSQADWNGVQEELKFEPRGALDGGKDGLDFYKRIIPEARHHLRLGGLLAFEVGAGQAWPPVGPARSRGLDAQSSQAEIVSTWLQTAGYDNIHRFKDYLGIERVVITSHP
jgi:release factor glutamine methyltransferase